MKCYRFQCFDNIGKIKYFEPNIMTKMINGKINNNVNGIELQASGNLYFDLTQPNTNYGIVNISGTISSIVPLYIDKFYVNNVEVSPEYLVSLLDIESLFRLNIDRTIEVNGDRYSVVNTLYDYSELNKYNLNNKFMTYECDHKENKDFFKENNITEIIGMYIHCSNSIIPDNDMFFTLHVNDKVTILKVNKIYYVKDLCDLCPELLKYTINDKLYICNINTFYLRCPDIRGLPLTCEVRVQ